MADNRTVAPEEAAPLTGKDSKPPQAGGAAPAKPTLNKSRTKGNLERAKDYVEVLKGLSEDGPIKRGIRCVCIWGLKPIIAIFICYVKIMMFLYKIYQMLPKNVLMMIFGVTLCFFGGMYFASLAAAEAAVNLGGAELFDHLNTVWEQAQVVGQAELDDNEVDANNDGIKDVNEMSTSELISHKAKVAAMAVTQPEKLESALMSLLNIWIAVLAVLKFQFAKTVALCLGITNMLSVPMARIFGPLLACLMGPDLINWVPTIIDTILKVIAVIAASFVQAWISAFYSGLRGGRLFAEGFFNILSQHGFMDKCPDWLAKKPFDPDTSFLDEIVAYPLFVAGFWYQMTHVMALGMGDFPLNILLLPLTIVEWIIRFQIFT